MKCIIYGNLLTSAFACLVLSCALGFTYPPLAQEIDLDPDTLLIRGQIIIRWDETELLVTNEAAHLQEHDSPAMNRFASFAEECAFLDKKATCVSFKTTRSLEWENYGVDLYFLRPIAIIPITWSEVKKREERDAANAEEDPEDSWSEKARNPEYVKKLRDYEVPEPTEASLSDMVETYGDLGWESSQEDVFARADEAIGGLAALKTWKGLLGRAPKRLCLSDLDYCSVVVSATYGGFEALAYCEVMNSPIGLGLPFKCQTVAYLREGNWYVRSFSGPEQTEGGAVSGAYCTFVTDKTNDEMAALLAKALKDGITNIELKPIKQPNGDVILSGKKIAVDSRIYQGYYEKAFAVYTISRDLSAEDDVVKTSISGLFNLLISAEPSQNAALYRDFGLATTVDLTTSLIPNRQEADDQSYESDLQWFQSVVLDVINNGMGPELAGKGNCVAAPIE